MNELSREEFLNKKRDYSPFLVHLTRDDMDSLSEEGIVIPASNILCQILDDKVLKAYSYKYCLFGPNLSTQKQTLQAKFRVVSFTETTLDQVDVLTFKVSGRDIKLEPYGLVFEKEFIKQRSGNPVVYIDKTTAKPLWDLYWPLTEAQVLRPSEIKTCNFLALVTLFDETMDFHWEREWRVVGDLRFKYSDIFCGLCPEDDLPSFKERYKDIKFIVPEWGIHKILKELVK